MPAVWLQSGDATVYATRGAAEGFVVIHYHRADGDYGDSTSSDFTDFWGLHVWNGAAETGARGPRRCGRSAVTASGPCSRCPWSTARRRLNYIIHRGDAKDPGPTSPSTWTCSGTRSGSSPGSRRRQQPEVPAARDRRRRASTRPDQGAGPVGRPDTVLWKAEPEAGWPYSLQLGADGGITAGPEGGHGGESIRLPRDPAG